MMVLTCKEGDGLQFTHRPSGDAVLLRFLQSLGQRTPKTKVGVEDEGRKFDVRLVKDAVPKKSPTLG